MRRARMSSPVSARRARSRKAYAKPGEISMEEALPEAYAELNKVRDVA